MISAKEMARLEILSEKYGVTKLMLMENAGRGLFKALRKRYDLIKKNILIICGAGNNGGDGFVLAKYLHQARYDVKILFLGSVEKLKKESGYNYFFLMSNMPEVFENNKDGAQIILNADIIVDAMLGTGIKGRIREPYSSIIDAINSSNATVVAVDIPTGLDPDTGAVMDKIVRFDTIYTFHDLKPGLIKYEKDVEVIDIEVPKEAVQEAK
ncbi:MAG: NAD(P)H-hydrate epimerase [Nanoarchaeota archaeon]|nr:NAD(P)H-hydrate epimerase [Nanoarchaeota archaeon]